MSRQSRHRTVVLPIMTLVLAATTLYIAPLTAAEPQRVAIAVSGGASKGAYEAGVNWAALTLFRQEGVVHDPVLGGRVRPYTAVSMAGASAGGINTLISALSWCAQPGVEGSFTDRLDDNLFRDVWLLPDINTLLPADPESPLYRADDAVLARNSLLQASARLRELWHRPIYRPGCRVALGVTVTRISPEVMHVGDIEVKNQRFTIPFELVVKPDRSIGFYYDPGRYAGLLDYSMILLPNNVADAHTEINEARIEQAVLATSAYPMAFGRKRLTFCRIKAVYGDESRSLPVVAGGLYCPPGYELSEAEFADGGLFDNLPIGLARTLAEEQAAAKENPFPVTYIYIDPNRTRYQQPGRLDFAACHGPHPPPACRQMEYSFISESSLLTEAFGTARNYELYRELASTNWSYNLTQLSLEVAGLLEQYGRDAACSKQLPYFDGELRCSQALRLSGRFLTMAYNRIDAPITAPFSIPKLQGHGLVSGCVSRRPNGASLVLGECKIDPLKFRLALVRAMEGIAGRLPEQSGVLLNRIHNAASSVHNDRVIRVTSRGAPITGELLGTFAAFLDRKFRDYDYYVGVYDAVVIFSETICNHHFPSKQQQLQYTQCRDALALRYLTQLGVLDNPRAHYIFALLARQEFAATQGLHFAYAEMPVEDRDMGIIHQALQDSLQAEWRKSLGVAQSSAEVTFFQHLSEGGFQPTPTRSGEPPLLAEILDDPDYWTYELTRRVTERLILLERQADAIFAGREPDPDKRPLSSSVMIGGAAYALRAATYKYSGFDFAPSTAPRHWGWRYVVPYEIAFDLVEGRGHFVWQPTWSLGRSDVLGLRVTVPVTGNLAVSSSRVNYYAVGLDYSHLTGGYLISSIGVTPGYYRTLDAISRVSTDSVGADIHLGLLKNKLRLGVGVRNLAGTHDSWFIQVGLTDLPGLVYWMTR